MAALLGLDAVATWARLAGRDFAAVESMLWTLEEANESGSPFDTAASGSAGYVDFHVLETLSVFGLVAETPGGYLLFAVGRPRLQPDR